MIRLKKDFLIQDLKSLKNDETKIYDMEDLKVSIIKFEKDYLLLTESNGIVSSVVIEESKIKKNYYTIMKIENLIMSRSVWANKVSQANNFFMES